MAKKTARNQSTALFSAITLKNTTNSGELKSEQISQCRSGAFAIVAAAVVVRSAV